VLVVIESLPDFRFGVHDKRSVLHNGFVQRAPAKQDKTRALWSGGYCYLVSRTEHRQGVGFNRRATCLHAAFE